jgi:hypothetical protein
VAYTRNPLWWLSRDGILRHTRIVVAANKRDGYAPD